jgi:histidine triad (HIT) family protein
MSCLFCKIVAGEIPATKVNEDEFTLAFMDINPATPGHLLVIPKQHVANVLDVDPTDLGAVMAMTQTMAQRVTDRLGAEGVTILNSCGEVAWQTVFHLHFHVIPRYSDDRDDMKLPWRPAPGDMAEIAKIAAQLNA